MRRWRGRIIIWLTGYAKGKLIATGLMAALIVIVFTQPLPAARTWTYWTLPLSGKVIVVDPGHGGADGGAKSRSGLMEKDVALKIGFYLRDYLQEAGAIVYMTREKDVDLARPETRGFSRRKTEDLKARANLVKKISPDVFISVHLNAIPSPRLFGPQTFYTHRHQDNATLAWFIQDELRTNVMETHRRSKSIHGIYVLEQSEVPTALVEVGFLSNEREAALLEQPEYQRRLAEAVYRGVLRYISGEQPPSQPGDIAPQPEPPAGEPAGGHAAAST